jgi:hypothetical protein
VQRIGDVARVRSEAEPGGNRVRRDRQRRVLRRRARNLEGQLRRYGACRRGHELGIRGRDLGWHDGRRQLEGDVGRIGRVERGDECGADGIGLEHAAVLRGTDTEFGTLAGDGGVDRDHAEALHDRLRAGVQGIGVEGVHHDGQRDRVDQGAQPREPVPDGVAAAADPKGRIDHGLGPVPAPEIGERHQLALAVHDDGGGACRQRRQALGQAGRRAGAVQAAQLDAADGDAGQDAPRGHEADRQRERGDEGGGDEERRSEANGHSPPGGARGNRLHEPIRDGQGCHEIVAGDAPVRSIVAGSPEQPGCQPPWVPFMFSSTPTRGAGRAPRHWPARLSPLPARLSSGTLGR